MSISSFKKAAKAIWKEFLISFGIIIALTLGLSERYYCLESKAQPDVVVTRKDARHWGFSRYIESGDGAFSGDPVTEEGKKIAFWLGLIGLGLVVIPAGMLGSFFVNYLEEEKRENELDDDHKKMRRAFHLMKGREFQLYLKRMTKEEKEKLKVRCGNGNCAFRYLKSKVSLASLQLQGMELKDVLDVCREYRDFRVTTNSSTYKDDFVLEHFPVNRRYGYFIDRGSKVTIVSTSSSSELGVGIYSYYLAKFGGFNYISKDINAAGGESFYNNTWDEPRYEGFSLGELKSGKSNIEMEIKRLRKNIRKCAKDSSETKDKMCARKRELIAKKKEEYSKKRISKAAKAIQAKKMLRAEFLADLESVSREGSWVICMLSHKKNKYDKVDIHVVNAVDKNGTKSTILEADKGKLDELIYTLTANMATIKQMAESGASDADAVVDDDSSGSAQGKVEPFTVENNNTRFPLLAGTGEHKGERNIFFKIKEDGCQCNGLVFRISPELMWKDARSRVAQFVMAQTIHEVLDPGQILPKEDVEDMNRSTDLYGYADQRLGEFRSPSLFHNPLRDVGKRTFFWTEDEL